MRIKTARKAILVAIVLVSGASVAACAPERSQKLSRVVTGGDVEDVENVEDVSVPVTSDCALQYPIVLSHHWAARKICPDDVDGEECEAREPARNCAEWYVDPIHGDRDCRTWRVPPEDALLPPRDVNAYDPALRRDTSAFHRYFSREIVDRLEACGNDVYLSDKPPFASYEVRARSLRSTVLQALEETGAAKVILFGMSQGAQDARYLAAELPVDDTDPSAGAMRDLIASIVTIVGEDGGAESASLAIDAAHLATEALGQGWSDYSPFESTIAELDEVLWEDSSVAGAQMVLVEGYDPSDPAEYAMTAEEKYKTFLRSLADNSTYYMQGGNEGDGWTSLRSYLGMAESGWDDVVLPSDENDNGIEYFGYTAAVHYWDSVMWGDGTVYAAIASLHGANDGYVTLDGQRLDLRGYPNFHHVKTMEGNVLGRGYHHMFFTGRSDEAYQPTEQFRDASAYGGSAADFYEQVTRDLRAAGF